MAFPPNYYSKNKPKCKNILEKTNIFTRNCETTFVNFTAAAVSLLCRSVQLKLLSN